MRRALHIILAVAALAFIWLILAESFSLGNIIAGVVIGIACLYFVSKFLPFKKTEDVNFLRLITYPFFIVGQVYLAGFYVMKVVFKGAKTDVVTVETKLKSDLLRVLLVDSITLTPGTILLDLRDEKITILWLRERKLQLNQEMINEQTKDTLERRLLKAQK